MNGDTYVEKNYWGNGWIRGEEHFLYISDNMSVRHREGAPAKLFYSMYNEGEVVGEQWYQRGHWHRNDGPAIIDYETGEQKWILHGITLPEVEYRLRFAKTDEEKAEIILRYS